MNGDNCENMELANVAGTFRQAHPSILEARPMRVAKRRIIDAENSVTSQTSFSVMLGNSQATTHGPFNSVNQNNAGNIVVKTESSNQNFSLTSNRVKSEVRSVRFTASLTIRAQTTGSSSPISYSNSTVKQKYFGLNYKSTLTKPAVTPAKTYVNPFQSALKPTNASPFAPAAIFNPFNQNNDDAMDVDADTSERSYTSSTAKSTTLSLSSTNNAMFSSRRTSSESRFESKTSTGFGFQSKSISSLKKSVENFTSSSLRSGASSIGFGSSAQSTANKFSTGSFNFLNHNEAMDIDAGTNYFNSNFTNSATTLPVTPFVSTNTPMLPANTASTPSAFPVTPFGSTNTLMPPANTASTPTAFPVTSFGSTNTLMLPANTASTPSTIPVTPFGSTNTLMLPANTASTPSAISVTPFGSTSTAMLSTNIAGTTGAPSLLFPKEKSGEEKEIAGSSTGPNLISTTNGINSTLVPLGSTVSNESEANKNNLIQSSRMKGFSLPNNMNSTNAAQIMGTQSFSVTNQNQKEMAGKSIDPISTFPNNALNSTRVPFSSNKSATNSTSSVGPIQSSTIFSNNLISANAGQTTGTQSFSHPNQNKGEEKEIAGKSIAWTFNSPSSALKPPQVTFSSNSSATNSTSSVNRIQSSTMFPYSMMSSNAGQTKGTQSFSLPNQNKGIEKEIAGKSIAWTYNSPSSALKPTQVPFASNKSATNSTSSVGSIQSSTMNGFCLPNNMMSANTGQSTGTQSFSLQNQNKGKETKMVDPTSTFPSYVLNPTQVPFGSNNSTTNPSSSVGLIPSSTKNVLGFPINTMPENEGETTDTQSFRFMSWNFGDNEKKAGSSKDTRNTAKPTVLRFGSIGYAIIPASGNDSIDYTSSIGFGLANNEKPRSDVESLDTHSYTADPKPTAATGDGTNADTNDEDAEYLANIKKLNESVSSWIKKHVDSDPYCLLTCVFKDYENHLTGIQSKKRSPK